MASHPTHFFENIVYLWNKMGFRHSSETHFVNSLKGVKKFFPLLLVFIKLIRIISGRTI
jgi:hypothetical protein